MNLFAFIKSLYVDEPVADETVWHKRLSAPWFATTINGELVDCARTIWRRQVNGKWEYQQDPETLDEVEARIW